MKKYTNVDSYIKDFPADIQQILTQVRNTIQKAAPGAEEVISYGMPAYRLHGMLVWFAAHKTHLGFYPRPAGILHFKRDLEKFQCSKGAVQFPLNKPMPVSLIGKMVKFNVGENLAKAALPKIAKVKK